MSLMIKALVAVLLWSVTTGLVGRRRAFYRQRSQSDRVRRRGSGDPKNIRVRARQEWLSEPDAQGALREQKSFLIRLVQQQRVKNKKEQANAVHRFA
jgi:hypothetical protein